MKDKRILPSRKPVENVYKPKPRKAPETGPVHEGLIAPMEKITPGNTLPQITDDSEGNKVMSFVVPEGMRIHVGPGAVIGKTVRLFKEMNTENSVEYLDRHGRWNKARAINISKPNTPGQGEEITFRASGQHAEDMLKVIWREFETNFTRTGHEYIDEYYGGER